jgi:hypothetical protein
VIPPHDNPVLVSNCSGAQVTVSGPWTQIAMPDADVVLQCPLTEMNGTEGVRILAHSIFVDGIAGGSIASQGKLGVQLTAGSASGSVCDSSATVRLDSTTVTASAGNADVKISACGDIVVNASALASDSSRLSVTSTGGRVCATDDSFSGHTVFLSASGDLTMHGSLVTTSGPRESISLSSNNGSVFAGGAPSCPPNRIQGGNDSSLSVSAEGIVDLSGACVEIAQHININANGTGFACATDIIVNLKFSEIRNDFGNGGGSITATACGGSGRIDIDNAILVDNGTKGGGSDPNKVANLNGSTLTLNFNCAAATTPACSPRPIDTANNPVSADPADRASHNVTGIPRCDS